MKIRQHNEVHGKSIVHLLLQSRVFLATGLLCSLMAVSRIYHVLDTASLGCSSAHHDVDFISSRMKLPPSHGHTSITSPCQLEYDRITSNRTLGLTEQDLLRSRAWMGNQYRVNLAIDTLNQRRRPMLAVVAGGSISLGHGTYNMYRYGEQFQNWMNEKYPLHNPRDKHQVINVAAHGADMCSMAKRLNILYEDLESNMPNASTQPDLIILEFAVNDYQGQDHLIMVDHKTSVFFDGFQELVKCAEVVVYSLLTKYPNAAIIFLEVQTAILTRKSGALLHMGVAQQYSIPVISYAEAMFPGYYRLMRKLESMDAVSYSFPNAEWIKDGGVGIHPTNVVNASQYASAVFPFPHGCSPCRDDTIIQQFRHGTYFTASNFYNCFVELFFSNISICSTKLRWL